MTVGVFHASDTHQWHKKDAQKNYMKANNSIVCIGMGIVNILRRLMMKTFWIRFKKR